MLRDDVVAIAAFHSQARDRFAPDAEGDIDRVGPRALVGAHVHARGRKRGWELLQDAGESSLTRDHARVAERSAGRRVHHFHDNGWTGFRGAAVWHAPATTAAQRHAENGG